MRLQFVGSGDAFGSGGRLNTCFHVTGQSITFLIDCGASSVIGLKRHGIDFNAIQALFITHFHADHFGGVPFVALRLTADARTLAYTGDSDWTEGLAAAGRDADLFVAEAYFFDKKVKYHLDLATLEQHLPDIVPKCLVLTHMSDDMLKRIGALPYETAEDGLAIEF